MPSLPLLPFTGNYDADLLLEQDANALLIGFVDTFGKVLLPQAAGVLVYVLMALILLWKPDGLFKAG